MKGKVIWFSGLSGSGKTTLANELAKWLRDRDFPTVIIDGDKIRKVWQAGFSRKEREEHLIRAGKLSVFLAEQNINVIGAMINPFETCRYAVKHMMKDSGIGIYYKLVYLNTSLEVCKKRDVKGLYKKAIAGEIKNFTGISHEFEEPQYPDLILDTGDETIGKCAEKLQRIFYT